ncbi:MAG: radical SAM protein [Deltaproteobacteria bacterium]|nr:radical SAM protein [Deltaproteobacteria bacterium]
MKPKVIFYQQYGTPYFGVISLMSYLSFHGIKSDVIIQSFESDPLHKIQELSPAIIGISVLSTEHLWLKKTVHELKKILPHSLIIAGGMHAILYPEDILQSTEADLVCNSEGEDVLLNVMNELDKPSPDWKEIKGLTFRDKNGNIHSNERAPLFSFRDDFIENRETYFARYPQLAKEGVHRFMSSRGCPNRCSFCYNDKIHDLFKGKGSYVRKKSPENFVREIEAQHNVHKLNTIYFFDDVFTLDEAWLESFTRLYKQRINIQFVCITTANLLTENKVKLLKNAGCITISFGLESGNQELRETILKRFISDDHLIRCGNLINKYGLQSLTTNMFCLPTETAAKAFQTIELNIKAKVSFFTSSIFVPFPNLMITDYCINAGILKPDWSLNNLPRSFRSYDSCIDLKDRDLIINIHFLAYFFVRYPWFYKFFRNIVHFKFLKRLFYYIFSFSSIIQHKHERKVTWYQTFAYAWRMRNSF